MVDLSTTYMGLKLKNPVVPSASPLSQNLDTIKKMEDAGAAAVVLHSLFEEQLANEAAELEHYLEYGTYRFAESLTYFPDLGDYKLQGEEYLEHIRKAKEAVDIPIVGSLNGVSLGGWTEYARKIEEAGADALELNAYYIAADMDMSGPQVEQMYLDVLKEVKGHVKIPVAMKLSPYFSAMANMAARLDQAGADALVLFNRFYQPDIDLDSLEVKPRLVLSSSEEMRLPLRWVAILYGRVEASLALTTGVHTPRDVARAITAGADVVHVCSVLLSDGIGQLGRLVSGLIEWMESEEYRSVSEMKGSLSQKAVPEPVAFERANYIKTLHEYRTGLY